MNGFMTFRLIYSKNQDDSCKSIVRIEPKYMRMLGIKPGDVVQVRGNTKETAAICLELDTQDYQDAPEINIEFLGKPEKKLPELPKMLLSGLVSCNIDPIFDYYPVVQICKFDANLGSQDNVSEATTVTLGTSPMAGQLMPEYKKNLNYFDVFDLIITKNDRINIPFTKDLEQKQQNEVQDPFYSPPSRCFSSVVLNVEPKGKPFWKITKNTKFEFKETNNDIVNSRDAFRPKNLLNVIPVSKQLHIHDTEFTIPSIEVYSNMMRLILYAHQRISLDDSYFTDSRKLNHLGMTSNANPKLLFTVHDDLGNQYTIINYGGGGSSGGPDPSTKEMIWDFSEQHILKPTLDKKAKEITITIKSIHWLKIEREFEYPTPSKPPHMTPITHRSQKILVAEGPWEFKINLK